MVLMVTLDMQSCCSRPPAYASGWCGLSAVDTARCLAIFVVFHNHWLASCNRCFANSVAALSFFWSNFFGGSSVM